MVREMGWEEGWVVGKKWMDGWMGWGRLGWNETERHIRTAEHRAAVLFLSLAYNAGVGKRSESEMGVFLGELPGAG